MIQIQQIHPIFVHFVIAPLIIAVVFDFLWLIKKQDNFEKFSWYSLIIAAIAGVLSVVSGLMAEENVIFPESSGKVFEYHELLAFILIICLQIQAFWRMGSGGKIPTKYSYLYFTLALASLTSVIITSYYGGKLVFEHGVGVKSSEVVIEKQNLQKNSKPVFQFVKPDTLIK